MNSIPSTASPLNQQLSKASVLNMFFISRQKQLQQVPMIILLIDASSSMEWIWPLIKKYTNQMVDKIRLKFGRLDEIWTITFDQGALVEKTGYITEDTGCGTEFGPPFAVLDQLIQSSEPTKPIKVLLVTDGQETGQTNWRNIKLGKHQDRNLTFVTIGIGKKFPFEATQRFYQNYHTSRLVPSTFIIKDSQEAEVKSTFEAVLPYLVTVDTKLRLKTPHYIYPWSENPQMEVHESSIILSSQASLVLTYGKAQIIVPPLPENNLPSSIERLQKLWYSAVMNTPSGTPTEKSAHRKMAKDTHTAILHLNRYAQQRPINQADLQRLNNLVYKAKLEEVIGDAYYKMSEYQRAQMADARIIYQSREEGMEDGLRKWSPSSVKDEQILLKQLEAEKMKKSLAVRNEIQRLQSTKQQQPITKEPIVEQAPRKADSVEPVHRTSFLSSSDVQTKSSQINDQEQRDNNSPSLRPQHDKRPPSVRRNNLLTAVRMEGSLPKLSDTDNKRNLSITIISAVLCFGAIMMSCISVSSPMLSTLLKLTVPLAYLLLGSFVFRIDLSTALRGLLIVLLCSLLFEGSMKNSDSQPMLDWSFAVIAVYIISSVMILADVTLVKPIKHLLERDLTNKN